MRAVIVPVSTVLRNVATSPCAAALKRSVAAHATSVNSPSESAGAKKRTTLGCLLCLATSSGCCCCMFLTCRAEAPSASSMRQIATFPVAADACRGVLARSSATSALTPSASNAWTSAVLPIVAAMRRSAPAPSDATTRTSEGVNPFFSFHPWILTSIVSPTRATTTCCHIMSNANTRVPASNRSRDASGATNFATASVTSPVRAASTTTDIHAAGSP
mmetsp:Transcript_77390/g.153678  ORF Transcript_77390/g.153678 Transcript_77390/m.153678 type:complete len:218 (-) Transcript_77390:571-1224(-)